MSAIISPCGLYRYRLERDLGGMIAGPTVAWIMVNPSTADAEKDDPTIRKVIGFSRKLGAARVVVGNLFAFRATDIKELRTAADPVGPENDRHLWHMMAEADQIVVAWGPCAKLPKPLRERWREVVSAAELLGPPPVCIGTAGDGHPLHPLMPSYSRPILPWQKPGRAPASPSTLTPEASR